MTSTIKFPHTLPTRETVVTNYEWIVFNKVLGQIDADVVIKSSICIVDVDNEVTNCKQDISCVKCD